MALTFYDLFAGIGGFHAAMTEIDEDARCVMMAEIDDAARRSYLTNFEASHVYEDVRTLTESPSELEELPNADWLLAGFPCQPFSKSGGQLGVRDKTRGTLFFDIMTIVEAKRPRFLLLENVKNLAGPRHIDTWRTIVQSIREQGYRVADDPIIASPHVVPPSSGGRPQVRERVFILAHHVGLDAEHRDLSLDPGEFEIALGQPLQRSEARGRVFWRLDPPDGFDPSVQWDVDEYLDLDVAPDDVPTRHRLSDDQQAWIAAWQDFVDHVVWPERARGDGRLTGFPVWNHAMRPVDEIEAMIDDETPTWKASHMRKNAQLFELNRQFIEGDPSAQSERERAGWRRWHGVDRFPASRQKFEWQAQGEKDFRKLVLQFRPSGLRVKRATYLPALVAITQTSIHGGLGRELLPHEAARLQGFPVDRPKRPYRIDEDTTQAFKQLGNAVNVGVVALMANALLAVADEWTGRSELRVA